MPSESAKAHLAAMTAREEQVLRRRAWGYLRKDIALHLGLSIRTIEHSQASAMNKAQLRNRQDLMRYAVAKGWLRREPH